MPEVLESYAQGSWFTPVDEGTPLADANTGETVARVSSNGPDIAGMIDHARRVGGPAVRALTFHQRANLLKEVAKHLMGHKEEFYALSHRTGATARDSAVDIDGKPISFEASGLKARVVQHELDHLDGVLFIDRLPPVTRDRIKKKIQKEGFPKETGHHAFAL